MRFALYLFDVLDVSLFENATFPRNIFNALNISKLARKKQSSVLELLLFADSANALQLSKFGKIGMYFSLILETFK